MICVKIDDHALDDLANRLDQAPDVLKQAKRQAFEQAAPQLKRLVDAEIGGTGKVQSWQEATVGSKGGYAAVRPKAKAFTEINGKGRRYAVSAVTAAIDSGHKFPTPSGKSERYTPRIRSGRQSVPGKQFYETAQEKAEAVATQAMEQVIQSLREHLEE